MDKKKATPKRSPKTKKSSRHIITSKQHIIIVDALRGNNQGMSSFQLRDEYSIGDPPARIGDLKRKGFNIHTVYGKEVDRNGQEHERVARYWLISEPKQEAA